jgi:hypothetical protein
MFKLIIAGAAVAEAALVLNSATKPQEYLQTSLSTARASAGVAAHEKAMLRATMAMQAKIQQAAASKGMSYAQYISDEDSEDDDEMEVGPDGLANDIMDRQATLSIHDFNRIHDEDKADEQSIKGEDQALIDANDAATHFGEDDQ